MPAIKKVSSHSIETYSKCPKKLYYQGSQKILPPSEYLSPNSQILASVIKDTYRHISRKGSIPKWYYFARWVESYYKTLYQTKVVDVQHTKELLAGLYKWYKDVFPKYMDTTYVNFPIQISLDEQIRYEDYIDLVTVGDKLRIFVFGEGKLTGKEVYNNLRFQSILWGFYKFADKVPDEFICLSIDQMNITPITLYPMAGMLNKTETFVRQILTGVRGNVYYPSFGQQCNTCPYENICNY